MQRDDGFVTSRNKFANYLNNITLRSIAVYWSLLSLYTQLDESPQSYTYYFFTEASLFPGAILKLSLRTFSRTILFRVITQRVNVGKAVSLLTA